MQVWQANRISDSSDFERKPYKVFANTEIMILYSYLMTFIGNIQDMERVREIAASMESRFKKLTVAELETCMSHECAKKMADLLNFVNTFFLNIVTTVTDKVDPAVRETFLPAFTNFVITLLNQIDNDIQFQDHWYLGLPMDNSADDIIVPVMWTETWVPLKHNGDKSSS